MRWFKVEYKEMVNELLKRYSRVELSSRLGAAQNTIWRWMSGLSVPSKVMQKRIVDLLNNGVVADTELPQYETITVKLQKVDPYAAAFLMHETLTIDEMKVLANTIHRIAMKRNSTTEDTEE